MKTYYISQGLFKPPLEVKIEGPPPCLFCGVPVFSPSMDGPLVCGSCDCGRNSDGSRWTDEERERAWSHCREQIAKYREVSDGVIRERTVDYDRFVFLAERAKYIRALRRAGYAWEEMSKYLNLKFSDQARQIHEQFDREGWHLAEQENRHRVLRVVSTETGQENFGKHVAALDAEMIATMPVPGTSIPAERCLSCGRDSDDDWSQCKGRCPHPLSPHYDPLFRARMIAAARAIDANPPTHRWDFATAEAVKLTPTGEDDPSGKRLRLDD
jgi:hypothetical protein